MRRISSPLIWAREAAEPQFAGARRVRGAKAVGVRYEKACAKAMPWATHGQWFEFADAKGKAVCQIDLLWFEPDGTVVVVEVKHTWTPEAEQKLRGLYCPVVEAAYGRPSRALVMCKRLVPGVRHSFGELSTALVFGRHSEKTPVFQWLGRAAIFREARGPILKRRPCDGQALST